MTELINKKLWPLEEAVTRRRKLQSEGQTLVITNGVFDLLHTGHLYYLRQAAALGDQLWILLNGDQSVRMLKGPNRPVQPQEERAYALAALEFVDGIVTFQSKRLTPEIEALKPDVYVKAGDYKISTLDPDERHALESVGAKIEILPFLEGYSTTRLIENIHRAADSD